MLPRLLPKRSEALWLESKKPGQIMPEAEHIEVVEAHVDADAPADKRQRRS